MPEALASLLSPLSPSDFRSRYYSKQSVHIGGSPNRFRDLFDLPTLHRILSSSPVPHPTMKLVLDGRRLTASDASAVVEHCQAGATLILEDIDKYDSRVGVLAANLACELGEPTKTNVYLSQPGRPGYNRHYDTHDVFILQIAGFKNWRVFDDPLKFPLFVQKSHPTSASETPRLECTLSPGDVLYVPRGHWHEANAQLEPSLHLTLGIYARTGIDFLTWLVDELREDVRWRDTFPLTFAEELPADGVSPEQALHFRSLRRVLSEALGDDDVLSRYRMFCIAQDRPVKPFSVPLFEGDAQSFAEQDSFDRPSYQRSAITRTDDATQVVVWGHVFTFSSAADPALSFIFSHDTFTIRELLDRAGSLSKDDVEAVLRVLLDHGIVERRRM